MTLTRILLSLCIIILLSPVKDCIGQATSFKSRYTPPSRFFFLRDHVSTRDNGMVLVGRSGPVEDSADITVIRLDESGQLLWSKIIPTMGRLENYLVTEMSDGSLAIVADQAFSNTAGYYVEALLLKLDCRGNTLFSTKLTKASPLTTFYPTGLTEGSNGDILVAISGRNTFSTAAYIVRVNNTGNIVFSKQFNGANSNCSYIPDIFYKNNKIYVAGYEHYTGNFIFPTQRLFAMILNYNNGNVESQQAYTQDDFPNTTTTLMGGYKYHFDAEWLEDNTLALFGVCQNSNAQNFYYYKLIIHPDLSIKKSQAYSTAQDIGLNRGKITVFPNGQTNITSRKYDAYRYYWYAADASNNILFQKRLMYPNSILSHDDKVFQRGKNNAGYFISHEMGSRFVADVAQIREGDNSITPCLGSDTAFVTMVNWQSATTSWSWASITDNQVLGVAESLISLNISFTKTDICSGGKAFQISGTASICKDHSTSYTYEIRNTSVLHKPVQWRIDQTVIQSMAVITDSSVSIQFKEPVSSPVKVKLYASSPNTCSPAEDSLEITIYPPPNLPGNMNLCNSTILADPGSWFLQYRWQDGSTNQTYLITQPGKYSVELTTYCNEVIKHSFEVFGNKTGQLPASITVCKGDTLDLVAPDGFQNYRWENPYNMNRVTDKIVEVWPQMDTVYVLFSETTNGCALEDSIRITVREKPVISLGKDTTLCLDGDLQLSAGNGFLQYLWNTGATTPSISVTKPGIYSVQVIDIDACSESDTIQVMGRNCPRRIVFPNAFTPNQDGKNDRFKPITEGRLDLFELMIYNRWGGLIFRTNNPQYGWDGAVGGVAQSTNTYVFLCRYQFRNEPMQAVKGTIQLIR